MSETRPGDIGGVAPPWQRVAVRVGIVVGAVVAAFGLLYGIALAVTASDIPRGSRVLGVDIGGRSVADATERLAAELPGALPSQMTVGHGERRLVHDIGDLGLGVDYAETAARARDGWASPWRAIPALFGAGRDVQALPDTDDERLLAATEAMNLEVREDFVEGGLRFDSGTVQVIDPQPGRGLDAVAVAADLERAFLDGRDEVAADVVELFPQVSPEAITRAATGIGAQAVSGPVTLRVAKDTVELAPSRYGPFLTTEPDGGELRMVFDAAALVEDLADEVEDLGREPRDASFRFPGDGEIEIVPHRPGISLDVDVLAAEFLDALTGPGPRIADAGARSAQPEFTTADAEALGITEKLSSFATSYPYAAYRVTNIGRAAELIDGSILMPGEVWSFNDTLGERTVDNGFVRGYIIRGGKFAEDLGGGVSQSATTTFNAAFFAGLKDIEHHPHSLYISRYPAGREATVHFGSKDLRFENDSGHPVYIRAQHEVGKIEVSMWGTKVWDEIESVSSPRTNYRSPAKIVSDDEDCEEQSPVSGFDITVTRVFIRDGDEVKRESFHTRYLPTDEISCVEPGQATASPDPSAAASPKPKKSKPPKSTPPPTSTSSPAASPPAPTPSPAPPTPTPAVSPAATPAATPSPSPPAPSPTPSAPATGGGPDPAGD